MTDHNPENVPSGNFPDYFAFAVKVMGKICGIREAGLVMNALVSELVAKTDSDQGVMSFIPDSRTSDVSTIIRVHSDSRDDIPYKISTQLLGWVLNNKSILKIDDLDTDSRFSRLDSHAGKYKSIICYPLTVRGEIIGLMTLIRSDRKRPFDEKHCCLMDILIPISAQILANVKLLDELTRSNQLLEISRQKLRQENIQLRSEIGDRLAFENIIGKSKNMKSALTLASQYSAIDSPLLITGETGTGKDLMAKAIHYNSERKSRQFVAVNCAFKTESLLESELFGHIRGSFTGAVKNKIGLFKEADGGTIFLDEIGDAPLSVQAAILRVIQTGEIRPLGSTKIEIVNVRVISASNKNLQNEMASGKFRDDLYYRLSTFLIELPPLRERQDDIPLLVSHFLGKIGIKLGKDKLSISSEALDTLMHFAWPGNVRQLESEIERAAVACGPGSIIDSKDLSRGLMSLPFGEMESTHKSGQIKDIVADVERSVIKRALAENNGKILQTARILGLTPKGLANKIKRYKIAFDFKKILSD